MRARILPVQAQSVHHLLRSIHLSDRAWIGGVHHHADAAHAGNQLRKRSQQLGAKIGRDVAAARGVAAGVCKTSPRERC
jgi:hypothetical protein